MESKSSINFTICDVACQEHSRFTFSRVRSPRMISYKYYPLVENNADRPGTCMTSGMKAIMTAASIGVSSRQNVRGSRSWASLSDDIRGITRSRGVNSNNTLAGSIRGKALIRILGHASPWITFNVQRSVGWRS